MPWHASRVGRTRPELFTCLSLLCHLAYAADAPLLQWDPDDVDLDGTGVPSHRVEIRISDPNTQCDKSKPGHKDRSWMTEMQHERNYLGLLDFGQMEAQGFLDIAGYEFVYQDHAVAFTDEFSTACEPPVLVFFDSANEIVDTVDPKGLSMTSIVKELAVCPHFPVPRALRADPGGSSRLLADSSRVRCRH